MLLNVKTVAAEYVDVSMADITEDEAEEEVDGLEEDTAKEVVEEAAAQMKTEFISQMSPVTLKIRSGSHSQTAQVKVSLRNRYAKSSW